MSKCQCQTRENKRCSRNVEVGKKFCWQHSPKPRGVGCKKMTKNIEKSKKSSISSSSYKMESPSNIISYLAKNNANVSFDDVTVYNWVKSNFEKYQNIDTSYPIQISFGISERKNKKKYNLFIGSEEDDDNMVVSKAKFLKVFSDFIKETRNSGKDKLHINLIVFEGKNEGENEFDGVDKLLKFILEHKNS